MTKISEMINNSKKIVVKIGSHVFSTSEGIPNKEIMQGIVAQINSFIRDNKQVIIVSSGAGIFGVGTLGKWSRRQDVNYKQALCAIGQVEMMMAYKRFFDTYDIHVAQILVTQEDFTDEDRMLHMRNTLFTLIDEGVMPVINENDSVSVNEIKIGDNDRLSALTAALWNADLLICLSDIDGVYDKDPKTHKDAGLIKEVTDIDNLIRNIDTRGKSKFGTGGIITKIDAAREAAKYGIPTIVINGRKKDALLNAVNGKLEGTVFSLNKTEKQS